MTLQEFIQKYDGVPNVGNTDANKGECVGLVMVYIDQVLDLSHIWGHARDIFYNAPENEWIKTENAPYLYPKEGDIMCWGASWGGGYGHIGVVESSSPATDSFKCFEQNYPTGSPPHIVNRTAWNGIIGWLTPKNVPSDGTLKEQPIDWDDAEGNRHEVGWYVREWSIEKNQKLNLVEEVASKNEIIDQLEKLNSRLEREAISKDTEISTITKERNSLRESYNTLEGQFNNFKEENALKIMKLQSDLSHSQDELAVAKKKFEKMSLWEFIKLKYLRG